MELAFAGKTGGAVHRESHTWTAGAARPAKDWLSASSARSAFLDHRKLLLLSDRTRPLEESFFLAAVSHLFAHLPVSATGNTVGALWEQIQQERKAYAAALASRGQAAGSGVKDPVAHRKEIEDKVNALNTALDDYLVARAGQPPALVTEAERLLGVLEGKLRQLKLSLEFDHLAFTHTDGSLTGGRLIPLVTFCTKDLTTTAGQETIATHHEVLNEARLTALAMAIFFAAAKLQNATAYIQTAGEPDEPARLLVMDDVLIGLDYDHRLPVLKVIREEFAAKGFQIILLTHNRVWFDLCKLEVEDDKTWMTAELYSKRGRGASHSDLPVRKKAVGDLIKRAKHFLAQNEWPAAANYARTAIENALKRICDKRRVRIPFRLDPEKHTTDDFLAALKTEKRTKTGTTLLVSKAVQTSLKSLRKTVLNPLTHGNSTTVGKTEIQQAIDVATKIEKIAQRCKVKEEPAA